MRTAGCTTVRRCAIRRWDGVRLFRDFEQVIERTYIVNLLVKPHCRLCAFVSETTFFAMKPLCPVVPAASAMTFLIRQVILLGVVARVLPSVQAAGAKTRRWVSSEEHMSELQSLMRISYAVLCL